jgi:enoyl-[acyl-carrier protein] reductase I
LDENSIAWKTAERIYRRGGVFVLTNTPASTYGFYAGLAATNEPADATSVTDREFS